MVHQSVLDLWQADHGVHWLVPGLLVERWLTIAHRRSRERFLDISLTNFTER